MRPVDILLRDRELHGYNLVKELHALLTRAARAPSSNRCLVVLGGPDALFIAQSEAAIEFLCQSVGFTVDADPESGTSLHLGKDYVEDSADWFVFQERCQSALRALKWAATGNSRALDIRVANFRSQGPLSSSIRFEITVQWTDELGNPKADVHRPEVWYDTYQPTDNGGVLYPMSVWFSSECDTKCLVTVSLLRRRLISDKLKGEGSLQVVAGEAIQRKLALVDKDSSENIGEVYFEADTLAFRLKDYEGLTTESNVAPSTLPRSEVGSDGDGASRAEWVEDVAKGPKDDGVKYDADDYF